MNGWVIIEDVDFGTKETIQIADNQPIVFFGESLTPDSYLAWALLIAKPGDRFSCCVDGHIHQMKIVASGFGEKGP